jgi:hypothetical protein
MSLFNPCCHLLPFAAIWQLLATQNLVKIYFVVVCIDVAICCHLAAFGNKRLMLPFVATPLLGVATLMAIWQPGKPEVKNHD